MPVRLRILSGSRQGEIFDVNQNRIRIGQVPTDDIVFDELADPGINGRRVILELVDGGWRLDSGESKLIFLNQDLVTKPVQLSAGDVIRLSHDGPDLLFDLADQAPSIPVADVVQTKRNFHRYAVPLVRASALLCLLAIVLAAVQWIGESGATADGPKFEPFGVLQCNEGESLFWRPTLVSGHESDRFSLGDNAPRGMTIDQKTGTIRWNTAEEDGPAEIACQIIVTRDGGKQQLTDAETLEIRIIEVNRPPNINTLPIQEINLRQSNELRVSLLASDPDIPKQQLTYQLKPGAPEGVVLNSATGQLSWTVDTSIGNRELTIPYLVFDSGTNPLSADDVVTLRIVSPDPWSVVETEIRESLYLVAARTNPGQLLLPIGTGCAVAKVSLLTSASVASAVQDALNRGWSVLAIDTRKFNLVDPTGLVIQRVESHSVYVKANDIKDAQRRGLQQAYFDLAILTTDHEMNSVARLGDVGSSVKKDEVVGCYGYEIQGGSLTRFDQPNPVFEKAKILEVITPQSNAPPTQRQPFLLQLIGKLPYQPFGGVIVNQRAEVLGVYAFRGQLPGDASSLPVHYAPEVMQVKSYLAGQGRDLWIETVDTARVGDQSVQ